ncbi:hypothetical protein Q5H93_22040 [Hymenobacter sp. ASUV-10]|uniref:T9SS type A sorting domain-containing protein n=1 Tax=Hymenobacter aranciens TaxID=3063996 RepID=A0ABT9BLL4_9BACT|nr:hypothetical protein [Hymenobacter sp. ASUV-10]MDO7877438.1 hypothetical protein [Hymenobacter sp. ASUV-10]
MLLKNLVLSAGMLLLLLAAPARAQQFDWVRTEPVSMTFNSQLTRYPAAADPAGNVAVAGFEANRSAATNGVMLGDMALVGYSPTGAVRFRRSLTGGNAAITHLRYASAGGLLALGVFKDSVRLGPGAVLRRSTPGTDKLPFLASFDAAGAPQWYVSLPQLLSTTITDCHALSTDAAGNIYLAVSYAGGADAVLRYNPLAAAPPTELLRQTNAGYVSGFSRAANGDFYLTGSCPDANASFGGVAAARPYQYSLYLARYSASGRLRWVRFMEDITCAQPQVAPDEHGGVYFAVGLLRGGMQMGPFQTTTPAQSNELLLARLDTAGTWQWLRQPPASSGTAFGVATVAEAPSLVADAQGNAALAATFRGSIAWPTGPTTSLGNGTRTDALVLSYDPAGTLRWVRPGGGLLMETAHGLAHAPGGELFLTGFSTSGPLTFGTAQGGPATAANQFFVARLAALPTATRAGQPGRWQLAPNPAGPATRLRFAPGAALPPAVVLSNALGQPLRTLPITGPETTITTAGLAPGLYWLRATAGTVRYQARLVVE